MINTAELPIIGRSERVAIKDVAKGIPAKIDTGAYRSAIHCQKIKRVKRNGKKMLVVQLLGHPCAPEAREMVFDKFRRVSITNSFGTEEKRYEVKLRVTLGTKTVNSSFTLAERSRNLFPILIGRKLVKNRFLIDVAHGRVHRLTLKKKFGIKAPIDEEDLED